MSQRGSILTWVLVVAAVGWLAWKYVLPLLPNLAPTGSTPASDVTSAQPGQLQTAAPPTPNPPRPGKATAFVPQIYSGGNQPSAPAPTSAPSGGFFSNLFGSGADQSGVSNGQVGVPALPDNTMPDQFIGNSTQLSPGPDSTSPPEAWPYTPVFTPYPVSIPIATPVSPTFTPSVVQETPLDNQPSSQDLLIQFCQEVTSLCAEDPPLPFSLFCGDDIDKLCSS